MVPLSGPLTDEVQIAILDAVQTHMRRSKLSQADVAEAIGQTATYTSNVLSRAPSIPPNTRDRILRDLNNWLERESRAAEAQRPSGWVETLVATRLYTLAERLTERADMALAWGPAGIGKSITIEAITSLIPNAYAIRAGHDTRTTNKLLATVYSAIATRKSHHGFTLTLAQIADRLRMPDRVSTRNLLMIDQAHELPREVYAALMELHDTAKCSILLVGTVSLATLTSSDADIEFGQLSSRIGIRLDLAPELRDTLGKPGGTRQARGARSAFTAAVVRKILAGSKLKLHPDAARLLATIACCEIGTARRMMRLFDWAERAAQHDGTDTVTVAHIRAAQACVEPERPLPELQPEEPSVAAATA